MVEKKLTKEEQDDVQGIVKIINNNAKDTFKVQPQDGKLKRKKIVVKDEKKPVVTSFIGKRLKHNKSVIKNGKQVVIGKTGDLYDDIVDKHLVQFALSDFE